jgi:hypothetical protein
MAFGEPYWWLDRVGTPLTSAPPEAIRCECCDRFISPTEHTLAYPTIHCWNCGHTIPAPDSWREWKGDSAQSAAEIEKIAGYLMADLDRCSIKTVHVGASIRRAMFARVAAIMTRQFPGSGALVFAILLALATVVAVFISSHPRR